MANRKVTDLTALTSAADADQLLIVDASASNQNKRITVSNLLAGSGGSVSLSTANTWTAAQTIKTTPTNGNAVEGLNLSTGRGASAVNDRIHALTWKAPNTSATGNPEVNAFKIEPRSISSNVSTSSEYSLNFIASRSIGTNTTDYRPFVINKDQVYADNNAQIGVKDTQTAHMFLERTDTTPSDGDTVGQITFWSQNDNSDRHRFARIEAFSTDISDGTEDGEIRLNVAQNSTMTEKMRINNNGTYFSDAIRIGGNAAANEFDDYEEGTWTPSDNDTGVTVTSNHCRYTKIGNVVHLWGAIQISTNTDTSNVEILGLPFSYWINSRAFNGVVWTAAGGNTYIPYIGSNSSAFTFYDNGSGGQIQWNDISGISFWINVSYITTQ